VWECDAAFASALQAITWPNSELTQRATMIANDATTVASIEATGQVPPVMQTQQYINDRQQLDDDLARQRLSQS
jgi:hypothetical protein